MRESLVSVRASLWDAFPQNGAVLLSEKEENRQVKQLLPLWSPYDIAREDSWELIFPEFHLRIVIE